MQEMRIESTRKGSLLERWAHPLTFPGLRQFLKFSLVGASGAVIDLGVLYLLVQFFWVWYIAAATISFLLAVTNNFLWNKFWTFRDPSRRYGRQYTQFLVVSTVGLGLNNVILFLLVEGLGLWYMWAKVFAIVVVLAWNFTANKYWTFRMKAGGHIGR